MAKYEIWTLKLCPLYHGDRHDYTCGSVKPETHCILITLGVTETSRIYFGVMLLERNGVHSMRYQNIDVWAALCFQLFL